MGLFNGFNQDTSGCLSPKPPSSPPITPLPVSPPKPLPPPPAPPAAPLPPMQPFREVLLGNGYCRVSGPDDRLTFVDTGCVSTQEECRANCHAFRNGCSCYSYTSPTEIEDDFDNCRPQALGRCNVYGDEQAFATSSGNQYYQSFAMRSGAPDTSPPAPMPSLSPPMPSLSPPMPSLLPVPPSPPSPKYLTEDKAARIYVTRAEYNLTTTAMKRDITQLQQLVQLLQDAVRGLTTPPPPSPPPPERNIAAQCCSKNGQGTAKCRRSVNNECIAGTAKSDEPPTPFTYSDMAAACERLSTPDDPLEPCDQSCSGTGCGYNKWPVYTKIPCNTPGGRQRERD